MFTLLNIWMIGKNSVKNHYPKNIFENFWNLCYKTYELDPAKFLWALGLARQAALKKTKVKLDLLTDIDIILMAEKGIRRVMCHSI